MADYSKVLSKNCTDILKLYADVQKIKCPRFFQIFEIVVKNFSVKNRKLEKLGVFFASHTVISKITFSLKFWSKIEVLVKKMTFMVKN